MVIHFDDTVWGGSNSVSQLIVVEALNDAIPTKHMGGLNWYTGAEFKRDKEIGTIIMLSQTSYIRTVFSLKPDSGFFVHEPQVHEGCQQRGGRAISRGGGMPFVDREPDEDRHDQCVEGGSATLPPSDGDRLEGSSKDSRARRLMPRHTSALRFIRVLM